MEAGSTSGLNRLAGSCDAVEVGRARAKRDQREHVEAAMHDELPTLDEEGQPTPQNHRSCESKLDPCPRSRRKQVLHRHGRQKYEDHQREHRHGEHDADPEQPRHIGQLWVGVFRSYLPRFERHAAPGAATRPQLLNLWMHGAGICDT